MLITSNANTGGPFKFRFKNSRENPFDRKRQRGTAVEIKKKKKGMYRKAFYMAITMYVAISLGVVFNSIHGDTASTNLTRWSAANSLGKHNRVEF